MVCNVAVPDATNTASLAALAVSAVAGSAFADGHALSGGTYGVHPRPTGFHLRIRESRPRNWGLNINIQNTRINTTSIRFILYTYYEQCFRIILQYTTYTNRTLDFYILHACIPYITALYYWYTTHYVLDNTHISPSIYLYLNTNSLLYETHKHCI